MLLSYAIIFQLELRALYVLYAVNLGQLLPTPDVLATIESLLRSTLAIQLLYYTCLWTIKVAFLIFFCRLGQKVQGRKVLWWSVTTVTIATWLVCIGTTNYGCSTPPINVIMGMYYFRGQYLEVHVLQRIA